MDAILGFALGAFLALFGIAVLSYADNVNKRNKEKYH